MQIELCSLVRNMYWLTIPHQIKSEPLLSLQSLGTWLPNHLFCSCFIVILSAIFTPYSTMNAAECHVSTLLHRLFLYLEHPYCLVYKANYFSSSRSSLRVTFLQKTSVSISAASSFSVSTVACTYCIPIMGNITLSYNLCLYEYQILGIE